MKQSALKLELPTLMGIEDFFISSSNEQAYSAIDCFWYKEFFAFNIYGKEGCGKTHLVNIFKDKYNALVISAKNVNMKNYDTFFYKNSILAIEDIDENIDCEAMFHLYNVYKNEGGYILFTSKKPLNQIITPIKDLNSRFGAVAVAEIKAPDDILLNALIVKLAYDKGININPDVISFILKRAERSFLFITKLINELDLLSLERQKAITVPMAKEVINFFEDNLQQELF
ncbi:MAG: DnaA/Hda family protein [Alphaproteobacteria bacterium]